MNILIVEDDANLAAVIAMTLRDEGHSVARVGDGQAGMERLLEGNTDLALLDLQLPTTSGLDILRTLAGRAERPAVVVVTACGTVETAVEAMKLGAADYLVKPFGMDQLVLVVARVLECQKVRAENAALRRLLDESALAGLVGASPPFRHALDTLRRAAASDSTVLLRGETGTGKDVAARALHAMSPRAGGAWVAVNCGAIPEALVETELFGHVKGAFTGALTDHKGKVERAAGGTLFFDEIAELPACSQVKLLRFLQEREIERVGGGKAVRVDVRIVAATHRDLREEVKAGRFREDLFYRLAVIEVVLPALRDRLEDLPALAAHALKRLGRPEATLSVEALAALKAYQWPGNVRELQHVLERALVLLQRRDRITPEVLPALVRTMPARSDGGFRLPPTGVVVEDVERSLLEQALERTGGNRTRAAQLLGLSRSALLYRIEKHQLDGHPVAKQPTIQPGEGI